MLNNCSKKRVVKLGATCLASALLNHGHFGPNRGHMSKTTCIVGSRGNGEREGIVF